MRIVLLIFLMFFFLCCKDFKARETKDGYNTDLGEEKQPVSKIIDSSRVLLQGLYGYKGLYSKFSMVDCPDYIEFTAKGTYYGYNDCGMTSLNDTIAEQGNYFFDREKNILILFDRMFRRKEYFENNSKDSLILNVKSINRDTIVIKRSKDIDVYYLRKNRLK